MSPPSPTQKPSPSSKNCDHNFFQILFFLSAVLSFFCYHKIFNLDWFFLEDEKAILKNPLVNEKNFNFENFFKKDFFGSEKSFEIFRPFTTFTFWLHKNFYGNLKSADLHKTNFFLHVFCAFFSGLVGREIFGFSKNWAFLATAFFAVHPFHSENLANLVGRAEILSALLFLASVFFYGRNFFVKKDFETEKFYEIDEISEEFDEDDEILVKNSNFPIGQNLTNFLLVVFLAVLSGLSDEGGFCTFFVLAALEVILNMQNGFRGMLEKVYILFLVGIISIFRWAKNFSFDFLSSNFLNFENLKISLFEFFKNFLFHGEFFRLLIFPAFLNFDYGENAVPFLNSFEDCRILFPLSSYLLLSFLVFYGTLNFLRGQIEKRPKMKNFAKNLFFSLIFLIFPLFPFSKTFSNFSERNFYVSSVGFVFLICSFGDFSKSAFFYNFVILLIFLSIFRTSTRCEDWQNFQKILLKDCRPDWHSAKANFHLAGLYYGGGALDTAHDHFKKSLQFDPFDGDAAIMAGEIDLKRGRFQQAEIFFMFALTRPKKSVEIEKIFSFLSQTFLLNNSGPLGKLFIEIAFTLRPDDTCFINNFACSIYEKNIEAAFELINRAIEISPSNDVYYVNSIFLHKFAKTGRKDLFEGLRRKIEKIKGRKFDMGEARACFIEYRPVFHTG